MFDSYDPWGSLRHPDTWSTIDDADTSLFSGRGYTGHEHLQEFQLINMNFAIKRGQRENFIFSLSSESKISETNGRMYDPVVSRFLSPDNYVQDEYNAQNYNRYSYVLNNPLKYTDPSGMLIDWYLNLQTGFVEHHKGNINLFDQGLIHLAGDDAKKEDIANSLTAQGFKWIYDLDMEVKAGDTRFKVDTEKQYKGWAMQTQ